VPAREALAFVAIPILFAVIVWAPAWAFLAVVGGAALVAGDELLSTARRAGSACGRALPLALLAVVLAAAWVGGPRALTAAVAAAVLLIPTAQLVHPERPAGALDGIAVSVFTVVYLGLTAACLGWLRQFPEGARGVHIVLLFLVTIWVGDSGAYYVGSAIGRHKMTPRISPNKSWEGLAGGVAATFAAAAATRIIAAPDLGWRDTLAVAAILAVAAPVGDLVESLIKRDLGVKDSSALLPGHGGFLDRTDSLFYSAPLVLAYLLLAGVIR